MSMILQYMFIKEYRTLSSQGLNFSNKFSFEYDPKTNKIRISENPFYIKNFYGNAVKSLTGVIGENGVGKTTILNYIKEVLSFPMTSNPDNLECILAFYSENKNEVLITSLGYKLQKSDCIIPKDLKLKFQNLDRAIYDETEDNTFKYNSILGLADGYSKNITVYLSNVFDGRGERDFGPPFTPYSVNLSLNYQVKGASVTDISISEYKNDEIYRSLKLVVNASQHWPSIKLPQFIRISFKNILVDDYIKQRLDYKGDSKHQDIYRDEIGDFLNLLQRNEEFKKHKKIRIRFWLCAYLLIQLNDYFEESKIPELLKAIGNSNLNNLQAKTIQFLLGHSSYLNTSSKKNKASLPSNFYWIDFIKNYEIFIETTLVLFDKYNNDSKKEYNSFQIPLTSKSESEISQFISQGEKSMIQLSLFYFSWNDMSTGETMLLRFFSNLYNFSLELKRSTLDDYRSVLFLIDEIESFYHPQWQKRIIKSMLDFINFHFSEYDIQIIFTSHSPLTISDIPKSDLIFLRKDNEKVIAQKNLNDHRQTFAANIHSLLSDSFFLQSGLIGDFANEKISEIINLLMDHPIAEVVAKKDYMQSIISLIGEPVIKEKLLQLLEDKLRMNLVEMKTDIERLKEELLKK